MHARRSAMSHSVVTGSQSPPQGLEEDDEFPLPDYSDSDDNDTSFPEDSNVDYESDARGGGNIPSGENDKEAFG